MATAKRGTKKQVKQLDENSPASEVVAHAVLADYRDLAPSVERILQSDLGEAGRHHAISLFQASLTDPVGDPMRNPANAIEAGRSFESAGR